MPARIPLLATGRQQVRLEPVVQRSGQAANRLVYDPYTAFQEELDLVPGRTDTVRPVVSYAPGITIAFREGFENNASPFVLDLVADGSAPQTIFSGDGVSSGGGSLRIDFSATKPVVEIASVAVVGIPERVRQVWLECDFRGGCRSGGRAHRA